MVATAVPALANLAGGMGKLFEEIDEKLAGWIRGQALFFVATAPERGGHVNLSPKGPIGSLRIVDGRTVEYEDHVGSGAETAAHIRQNGRICIMLCAFSGPPRIVRLYGLLERVQPSPIVSLNRAVAVAMVDGPRPALALMDALAATGDLDDYHLLHAARADLLRRLGSSAEAAKSYATAITLVTNDAERRFLDRRLREVQPPDA